ncbi:MAG: DNA polymerase Y family protein [Gordonia sp. (in: high G+C Gram-positive bacteria)]|uniref:DNA polymerase Y family protein n=1 Tax=Gordonia sp. (in: high G+C Gram-positive bacteria) TaxID=84139 RepID=UPI0039E4FF05
MARRVLAVWAPDWPAVAAAVERDLSPDVPVAVLVAGRVTACSAPARRMGIRRGMRKRQAQSNCPELVIVADDPDRAGRLFAPVVTAVAAVLPSTEVLRPGLLAAPTSGMRYFGSEENLAAAVVEAVADVGAEVQLGIADQMFTAVLAARRERFVPPGGDAEFLAPLPIRELAVEPALGGDTRDELVDLLWRLGLRTVGAFAGLDAADVGSRFDAEAVLAHRQASGQSGRAPSGRPPQPELVVEHSCDPPVTRIDEAAFLARRLSAQLHERLAAASVSCTRLAVRARTERGQENSRIWCCALPLTAETTADRVRWQLEGWLTEGAVGGAGPDSPVIELVLEPVEVSAGAGLQYELPGPGASSTDGPRADRIRRALVRVQGLLGADAVMVPVRGGGRGPAEQITLIPAGESAVPALPPDAPWPSRLPEPTPAVLVDAPVAVCDDEGTPVAVTVRGAFSGEPVVVTSGSHRWSVRWWAGPWPCGLSGDEVVARAQVLLDDERALLLRFGPEGQWWVEGVYE